MKKENFRNEWKTLTELGDLFGLSARKLGILLKDHGIRNKDGSPSVLCMEKHFSHLVEPKGYSSYWLWNKKIKDYLIENGVKLTENAISEKESSRKTEIRKLARDYIEAQELSDDGQDKMRYFIFDDLNDTIKEKKITLTEFNEALKNICSNIELEQDDFNFFKIKN